MDKLENKEISSLKTNYTDEIIKLIKENKYSPSQLRKKLEAFHENDIAEALIYLSQKEVDDFLEKLGPIFISTILEYTEPENAAHYLSNMKRSKKAALVIENIDSDDALEIIDFLPKDKRKDIIESMDEKVKKDLDIIAQFDDEEIGSRMTTDFIIINQGISVKEAMSSLISQASTNDNISTIFVENEDKVYHGAIDLKELIRARKSTDLDTLITTTYPYVYGNEQVEDIIEELKDYSEDLIPVLDADNRIQGVITSQSIIEVVDEIMGEDYAQFAGLTAEEDLKEPLIQSMKKRLPWLIVLLFLGMLVSSVVGAFEAVVAQLTLIMSFQSLILDMAGNVGTQSLAVTIRVLTDENLTGKQKLNLVYKETRVGFINGLLLGSMTVILLGLFIHFTKGRTFFDSYLISSCIGSALMIAMIVSSALGTLIPIFFKKVNVDPAVASGPLITTVNDLVAVVTYYGLSYFFLIQLFHLAN